MKFFLYNRIIDPECKLEVTEEQSVVLIRDYLESLADSGRTAPESAKRALGVRAGALGVDWPLNHTLVTSAALIDPNEDPKQSPAMNSPALRKIEELACAKLATPSKRAFAAGIVLGKYARLRFPDAHRIRSFDVNDDSVYGPLLDCKARKIHGQFGRAPAQKKESHGLAIGPNHYWTCVRVIRKRIGREPTFSPCVSIMHGKWSHPIPPLTVPLGGSFPSYA